MITEIDSKGAMVIKPENELENYALTKWWDDWQARKVCLSVRVQGNIPGGWRSHQIEPDDPS